MKIAFVSSEIVPYASTGGLADVCDALPKALNRLGIKTVQIMPMYRSVMEGSFPIADTGIRLSVPVGFHHYVADVWKTTSSDQEVYFIRRDEFFDRSQLYNLSDRDYDDNFERFIFFQKAVTALIDHLGQPFDIVHAHDWQTGLLPSYLRHGLNGEGRACKEKIVYTIHNLAFQGIFDGDEFSYTNLPFSSFSVDNLEYYGNVNCLKGGIISADLITTVSKTYADEILTEEWGCGLHGVLSSFKHKIAGILNGIDTDLWNPENDQQIRVNYSVKNPEGKKHCKADLIARTNLKIKQSAPLFGFVSRLTTQKGVELIDSILPKLIKETDAGFVILGNGSEELESLIQSWAARWPGRVAVKTSFDVTFARQIMAGCDIYLMPSKFEPCGLNQLYSMRYGAIPVVHQVGGLADTVIDATDDPTMGCGFKFKEYKAQAFYEKTTQALNAYSNTTAWNKLIHRAMSQNYDWQRSAEVYKKYYADLMSSRDETLA